MKIFFTFASTVCAAVLLASCGGTKDTVVTTPATQGEFDPSTGSWKPLTKVVTPPPPEQGAVIIPQKGPGMMDKVGSTLKKPLKWVGLGKEETQPAPVTPAEKKKTAKP